LIRIFHVIIKCALLLDYIEQNHFDENFVKRPLLIRGTISGCIKVRHSNILSTLLVTPYLLILSP